MFWRKGRESDVIPGDGGLIRAFGLQEWWTSLPEETRSLIVDRLGTDHEMFDGTPGTSSASRFKRFGTWAGFFKRTDRVSAGLAILDAAERLGDGTVTDWHFHLGTLQELRYKQRGEDPTAIDDTAAACERMVEIADEVADIEVREYGSAPPGHAGFDRLIAIRKKQGRKDEVERLTKLRRRVWDSKVKTG